MALGDISGPYRELVDTVSAKECGVEISIIDLQWDQN